MCPDGIHRGRACRSNSLQQISLNPTTSLKTGWQVQSEIW
jgi:hypothetical protein